MPILRRSNCIVTASGIVTLCKQPFSAPVESGLHTCMYRLHASCLEIHCRRDRGVVKDELFRRHSPRFEKVLVVSCSSDRGAWFRLPVPSTE